MIYFPKNNRHHKVSMYLMVAEIPLNIMLLILTGIASHDLYRTLLRQDGADNGFNSAPNEALYAAANYQPYNPPMVWSDFLTHYNLVLSVLSLFFLITKFPVHLMRLLYPPIAAIIHVVLIALWVTAARYQAGPDMSDPRRPQPGPPWYITKSCSVAALKSDIGYCQQAKALFAFSLLIVFLYTAELGLNLHSCFITKEEREEIKNRREEKRAEKEFEEEIINSPGMIPMAAGMIPRTPGYPPMAFGGAMSPFTPRTLAFNRLGSGSDLPLRENIQASNGQSSSSQQETPIASNESPMYFPPPPKKAATKT